MPFKNLVLVRLLEPDESAVYSLPLRFTISGILFSVLLLISAISVNDFLDGAREKETLDEVLRLTSSSEQLTLLGEGSEVALEFNLPDNVAVDFGVLPGRLDKWPADANNYCIRSGKKTASYSTTAFFSKPGFDGPVSLGPGRHKLLLKTKAEPISGKIFVVISEIM